MATLYTHKDSNIRRTWFLMTVFLVLIIGFGWLFGYILENQFILIFAVLFSVITSFLSYWYSDKIILALTRARPIVEKDARELYRTVQNLCITAGMPMPRIYILNESQPNAFATGRNEKHAVIAVTTGLLAKLRRLELQGVIAHEIAHIKNRDTLLQTVAVVLAGVIAIASNIFLRFSFFGGGRSRRSRDSRGGQMGAIFMLIGIVTAILAPLAATLIRLAISRKREFLADATGALLTRYPEGLASALEKVSRDPAPMRVARNYNAHLFIISPFRGRQGTNWFNRLFLTHPSINERIKRLRER